jgi:hypothetical protein
MERTEAQAIADEDAMQRAMRNAYARAERTGQIDPATDYKDLGSGLVAMPYIEILDEDFE